MRGRASYPVLFVLSAVWPLAGQDGSSLSRFFETKQVSVKIDMPATQQESTSTRRKLRPSI
jgi:hypothetical protein